MESVNFMEEYQTKKSTKKPSANDGKQQFPSEHLEQVRFVSWFRREYPDVRIIAIPNGGGRSKAQAGALRAEGVVAGVPDLFIPEMGTWIEMKRQSGGKVSPEQTDWLNYLHRCGYRTAVCKGFEAAKEFVLSL